MLGQKDCDGPCCRRVTAKAMYDADASDRTDFNPGDFFVVPAGPVTICVFDDLVNECFPNGKDFDISGSLHQYEEWWNPCSSQYNQYPAPNPIGPTPAPPVI